MLAEAFMEGKDYESAIQVSNWIIEDDKFSTEARTMLANAYMKLGNYPKAIDYLRALADENSLDIVIQNNLGVAHSRIKQYDLAARIFEKTIRIDKANAVGYYNLAICYAQQNMAQKACDQIYAAAEQFGPSFVAQWTTSKQFAPIADTAPFERLAGRFRSYINEPSPEATGLLPPDKKPTAPFGSAALPGFNLESK
jgi:tetratricopeptide (TPR) repeat protein